MPSYLEYQLRNGYIHNWLVAGPAARAVPDLERYEGEDFKLQIARHNYEHASGVVEAPVERGALAIDETELTWSYVACQDDHFVDRTAFYRTCHYLRSWAYTEILCPEPQEATFVLTTNGPADFWLNGEHIHRQEHFHHQIPHSRSVAAALREGWNEILVRFEEVAVRECPYAMALEIVGLPSGALPVRLSTTTARTGQRQKLERIFETASLDRDVYATDDEFSVRWPADLNETGNLALRLQTPSGRIYGEAWPVAQPAAAAGLGKAFQLTEGAYQIVLMPRPEEYYLGNMRVRREIPVWVTRNSYSQSAYGTYEQRRHEALLDATRRPGSVFAEIAKMELGRWSEIQADVIRETIAGINRRQDCSDFYMVGLLGVMYRYLDDPSFPEELKLALEECVLNFKYWMDEPGSDAMCYWSENHQILFHACEILAGQLYPDREFTNVRRTGRWHREKGVQMALSWLRKRGTGGFKEWDSNCYFEEDILALAHLADLAESPEIQELAAIVMDKLLFTVALNSYRGVFGSTHGRTYAPLIKGGRRESTAGITRLMWGMGVFNEHILGTVSLACADYELPVIIQQVATDQPEALWSRERHAGELEPWCDRTSGAWEVHKVTYKTPDYMLCSAQDFHPGEPGYQQHIWQATFGPDAVVFVTHPPCVSEESSHRPNFWHGNVILPRVAQWHDTLIAIHKLPQDDWLGFTHAYFPVYAFDDHRLRDGYSFARKGDGYLALTAAAGVELSTRGANAYRELRSYGLNNIWMCQMGRAALDGSFEEFQERVLALDLAFDGLSVRSTTPRGETLTFGWEEPLTVAGTPQPLKGFRHYDSPYCVVEDPVSLMDIRFGDDVLRLRFDR